MNDSQALTTVTGTSLDLAVSVWLNAQGKHIKPDGTLGHTRTSEAYEKMMDAFRRGLRKEGTDLNGAPGKVALMAQAYASFSTRGEQVSASTYNLRLACLSSFYRYARKLDILSINPIERLDRKKVQQYAHAVALNEEEISAALTSIDQTTIQGARDYAILSIYLQTARRAQEVATLEWRHVSMYRGRATLTFEHTKGGDILQDELPIPVTNALFRWLYKWYGKELGTLAKDAPLWVSIAPGGRNGKNRGQQLGTQGIADVCKRYLGTSKVHVTRHTAAHHMEKVGLTTSEIQARLGHKSIATTGRYLESLRRAQNRKGDELAALYGIE